MANRESLRTLFILAARYRSHTFPSRQMLRATFLALGAKRFSNGDIRLPRMPPAVCRSGNESALINALLWYWWLRCALLAGLVGSNQPVTPRGRLVGPLWLPF
jgi:hypothetical protein